MFRKTATVQSIATATYADDIGFRRVAASSSLATNVTDSIGETPAAPLSYYLDGARKVDVRAMLKDAASKFDISTDPSDYIFEAIRANTTNIPNENHDAFHKNELLRYDTQRRMAVYLTYIGKPHHLNHSTSDPKRARGVILDAHYNEVSPALANCPQCHTRTAEANERDPSGIHCAACGTPVKDEFVEILVAVDTKKDPALVRGIQAGILNAGSMGCSCSTTTCNVCENVARTTQEFCTHIRAGAKGSLWLRSAEGKYERTTSDKVKGLLKEAGYQAALEGSLVPVSTIIAVGDKSFEVRKAFENCQGVEFDEYSRVHRPADPKARTTEILSPTMKAAGFGHGVSLEQETEQLINRARLAHLEASMSKSASAPNSTPLFLVRVNGNDSDIHGGLSIAEAVKKAEAGRRDKLEKLAFTDKGAQWLPMEADVQLIVPDGMQVHMDQTTDGMPGQPGQSGQMPGMPQGPGAQAVTPPGPQSIEDVTQQEINPGEQEQSPEEFGMLPPGASDEEGQETQNMIKEQAEAPSQTAESGESKEPKFAIYRDALEAHVFEDRIALRVPGGEVFSVKFAKKLASQDAKYLAGNELIDSVLANGLVRTALKYKASFSKRIADVTDGAMFNMVEHPPMESGGALAGSDTDMAGQSRPTKAPANVTDEAEFDHSKEHPMPKSTIESRDNDLADGDELLKPKSVTEDADDDMKDERPSYSMSTNTLDGAEFDMKRAEKSAPKTAETQTREADLVRKLYAARLEKVKAEYEADKAALEATILARVKRAMKIAVKRQQLNAETSPLKAKVLDSLTVNRPVGRHAATGETLNWMGMDQDLALHLVEAAWQDSGQEEVDTLIERTAELMTYDDKYLVSAEKDLAKQAMTLPQVTSLGQLEPRDEVKIKSASLRSEAMNGNLTLAPSTAELGSGSDRLSRIREALGSTTISQLNDQFRPSA